MDKKAYHREYYRKNREWMLQDQKARDAKRQEELRAYRRAYYLKNRERILEQQRERNRQHYKGNQEKYRERNRKARFRKFGLTQDQYQDMLDAQGGGCAICTTSFRVARMAIDHCHKTGLVRGILCVKCNTALGLLGDFPERIMEAARYVEKARLSSGAT